MLVHVGPPSGTLEGTLIVANYQTNVTYVYASGDERGTAHPRTRFGDANGFTLVELLIVIAVLGILAAVVIFSLGGVTAQASVSACETDGKTVETAVAAYEAQSGDVPPASLSVLTQGSNPYLQSVPSSPYYSYSLVNGVVMVSAPPSATPVNFNDANSCSGAGSASDSTTTTSVSSSTTTGATTTTSTSVPPTSTTTTVPPTSTTTTSTTTPPTRGITVAPHAGDGEESLSLAYSEPITALTITITVESGGVVKYVGEQSDFPTTVTSKKKTSTLTGVITYTFTLASRSSIPVSYSGSTVTAEFSVSPGHDDANDTWSVVGTSGVATDVSGNF